MADIAMVKEADLTKIVGKTWVDRFLNQCEITRVTPVETPRGRAHSITVRKRDFLTGEVFYEVHDTNSKPRR